MKIGLKTLPGCLYVPLLWCFHFAFNFTLGWLFSFLIFLFFLHRLRLMLRWFASLFFRRGMFPFPELQLFCLLYSFRLILIYLFFRFIWRWFSRLICRFFLLVVIGTRLSTFALTDIILLRSVGGNSFFSPN